MSIGILGEYIGRVYGNFQGQTDLHNKILYFEDENNEGIIMGDFIKVFDIKFLEVYSGQRITLVGNGLQFVLFAFCVDSEYQNEA